jgi:hypothetical protein
MKTYTWTPGTLGALLALAAALVALVLIVVGQLDFRVGGLIIAVAVSRLT